MDNTSNNLFFNPSKKMVVIAGFSWLAGVMLLVIAMTNGFTESLFQRKYLIIDCMVFGSALTIVNLYARYLKNKRLSS